MQKLYKALEEAKTSNSSAICRWLLPGLLLFPIFVALAQKSGPKRTDSVYCATPTLSEEERQVLEKQIRFVLDIKKASGENKAEVITYVPIKPHIFRRTNGTGGMTLNSLNNVLATANRYYLNNGSGIQFYFCGTAVDYIDNDDLYKGFPAENETSVQGRDATNAMNVYFVNYFTIVDQLGYAYFPDNSIQSTRSFVRTGGLPDNYIGDYILSHELGHNFGLYHTFQGVNGQNPELVTRGEGANCSSAGDLLCDTPADPYNYPPRPGFSTAVVNGCEVYTGTIVDPNGQPYNPQMGNIMSYYEGCNLLFTPGQYEKIQGGLGYRQTQVTAYNLSCAPTVVAAVTNLNAVSLFTGGIRLTWQDNVGNELGYIIERASGSNGLFVPVGGVGPNITTFTDVSTAAYTNYSYRVRPSNSSTEGISTIMSAMSGADFCRPTFTKGCTDEDGLNTFTVNGVQLSTNSGCSTGSYNGFSEVSATVNAGQTIAVEGTFLGGQYPEGAAIWADLNRNSIYEASERLYSTPSPTLSNFSGSITIPANVAAGLLTLRVIVRYNSIPDDPCGRYQYGEAEDYVLTVNAATTCPSLYTVKPGSWNDASVWSCNRIPGQADPVEVRHAVLIPANMTAQAQRIKYALGGQLLFGAGGRIQTGF